MTGAVWSAHTSSQGGYLGPKPCQQRSAQKHQGHPPTPYYKLAVESRLFAFRVVVKVIWGRRRLQ